MPMPASLEAFRLASPVDAAFLLPHIVTVEEEAYLLRRLEELGGVEVDPETVDRSSIRYKSKGSAAGWREVSGRRSMYLGGQVVQNTLIPSPLPGFLKDSFPHVFQRVLLETGLDSNHALINEYLPHQGISPHCDGPAYEPTVATLSLGSHTVIDFYAMDSEEGRIIKPEPEFSIFVPRRSLFVLCGDLYLLRLHGIAPRGLDKSQQLNECVNRPLPITCDGKRERRVSMWDLPVLLCDFGMLTKMPALADA